jgi:alpha-beta hydrolase superfamily lysophospholipase
MTDVKKLVLRIPSIGTRTPLPTIILEPGFFSVSTDLEDVANRYASHGFIVIGVTNTSHYKLITTSLEPYRQALLQTIQYAVESCKISTSQHFGLVDTNAIGVSGHSMGGGGTIMACDSILHTYSHYIKTAVAMNPFGKCSGFNIKIPVFLFSSELDAIFNPFMPGVSSSPGDVFFTFQSIPSSNTKLYANFKGMDHNAVVDKNFLLSTSGNAPVFLPSMVSWFKVYLAKDTSYQKYIDTTSTEFLTLKSRFIIKESSPDYLYNIGSHK